MCSHEKSWEFSQTRFSTMDKKHPDFSMAILKFTAMDLSWQTKQHAIELFKQIKKQRPWS